MLSAVQRTGGSGKGFRSFRVEALSALQAADQRFFGKHPDYDPGDPCFMRILGQI